MSKFMEAHTKTEKAEEVYLEAKLERDVVITSVLEAMGLGRNGVESVIINQNIVYICYGWSCRGSFSTDDIELPLSIFEADDPIQAAKEYKAARDQQREQARIAEKRAQLEKLQRELEGK